MRLAPILLFLLAASLVFGQSDSLRARYVHEYPDYFFIWPVIKYRSLSFEVGKAGDAKDNVEFIPNNSVAMGVGFYIFELGFELAFAVPLDQQDVNRFGESKARDIQLNVLSKKWGADLYYQKYEGYYKDDSRVTIPEPLPLPQRPDINTRNIGISGFYVFNHRKFSLRSSFNFSERQLQSKGSFIVYGTINSFRLIADSVVLSPDTQVGLGKGSDFQNLRYTTFSLAPGYSYNIIKKKFFANLTLSFGPAHHWVYLQDGSGNERDDLNINSTITGRFGLGYNGDRFFAGIGLTTPTRLVKFEKTRFSNSTNFIKIVFGYRFKEFGILKKRTWDLLPQF